MVIDSLDCSSCLPLWSVAAVVVMLVVPGQVEQAASGRLKQTQSYCRPTAANNVRAEPVLHPLVCHLEAIRSKSAWVKPGPEAGQPSGTGHGLWEMKSAQTAQAESRPPSSSLTSPQILCECVYFQQEKQERGWTNTRPPLLRPSHVCAHQASPKINK